MAGNDGVDARKRRGLAARLGVSALNILGPGLGLLRIGERRMAWIALACAFAMPLLLAIWYRFGPPLSFGAFAAILIIALAYWLVVGLGSIIATFRRARAIADPLPAASRWYVLAVIAVALFVWSQWLVDDARRHYRNFNIPSESMRPTLLPGDRFVARIGASGTIRRGDMLIVEKGKTEFVKRVIALPGETVSLARGVVRIDGRPLAVRSEGATPSGCRMSGNGAVLREYPRAGSSGYLTLDCGDFAQDDFAPIRIPPGHYFLLGDNRDLSADSRFGDAGFGLGLVPQRAIVGRPLFLFWSSDRSRIGETLR